MLKRLGGHHKEASRLLRYFPICYLTNFPLGNRWRRHRRFLSHDAYGMAKRALPMPFRTRRGDAPEPHPADGTLCSSPFSYYCVNCVGLKNISVSTYQVLGPRGRLINLEEPTLWQHASPVLYRIPFNFYLSLYHMQMMKRAFEHPYRKIPL